MIVRKIISIVLVISFVMTTCVPESVQAQVIHPVSAAFQPVVLQGIRVDAKDPFHLEFVVNPGDSSAPLEEETSKLTKYFLAALTVPGDDLWVNLSPAEPDRIITPAFGQTAMGHDLLAQDYLLKQITSSLLSPENEAGKKFWEKVYERVYESVRAKNLSPLQNVSTGDSPQKTGTAPLFEQLATVESEKTGTAPLSEQLATVESGSVPVSQGTDPLDRENPQGTDPFNDIIESFNKVWIVPDVADVYQNGTAAYIVNARLKVMLEEDYLASGKSDKSDKVVEPTKNSSTLPLYHSTADLIHQIIIPIIEKEVNEGENFAQLRQIYHAVILAKWFKENLRQSLLGAEYVDRNKVNGIDDAQKDSTQTIYNNYLEAFRKGAYDAIHEEYDPVAQEIIPRKYFTGGFSLDLAFLNYVRTRPASVVANAMLAQVSLAAPEVENPLNADEAMLADFQADQVEILRPIENPVKVAFFDWDGVIQKTAKEVIAIKVKIYTRYVYGSEPSTQQIEEIYQEVLRDHTPNNRFFLWMYMKKLHFENRRFSADIFADDLERFKAFYMEQIRPVYKNFMVDLALVEGVMDFLEALKQRGIKMYVLSRAFEELRQEQGAASGLEKYFESIFGSSIEIFDPRSFSKTVFIKAFAEEQGWDLKNIMLFDDDALEVGRAAAEGLVVVGVPKNSKKANAMRKAKPHILVRSSFKDYHVLIDEIDRANGADLLNSDEAMLTQASLAAPQAAVSSPLPGWDSKISEVWTDLVARMNLHLPHAQPWKKQQLESQQESQQKEKEKQKKSEIYDNTGQPWIFHYAKQISSASMEVGRIYRIYAHKAGLSTVVESLPGHIDGIPGILIKKEWSADAWELSRLWHLQGANFLQQLSGDQILDLVRQYVLDWLMGRVNIGSEYFIIGRDERVFYPEASWINTRDSSTSVSQKTSGGLYKKLFHDLSKGHLDAQINREDIKRALQETVDALADISDEQMRADWEEYLDRSFGDNEESAENCINHLLERKNGLSEYFERFFAESIDHEPRKFLSEERTQTFRERGSQQAKLLRRALDDYGDLILAGAVTEERITYLVDAGESAAADFLLNAVEDNYVSMHDVLLAGYLYPHLFSQIMVDFESLFQPQGYAGSIYQARRMTDRGIFPEDVWRTIQPIRDGLPSEYSSAPTEAGLVDHLKMLMKTRPSVKVEIFVDQSKEYQGRFQSALDDYNLDVPVRLFTQPKKKYAHVVKASQDDESRRFHILIESRRFDVVKRGTITKLAKDHRTFILQNLSNKNPFTIDQRLELFRQVRAQGGLEAVLAAQDVMVLSKDVQKFSERLEILEELIPFLRDHGTPWMMNIFVDAASDLIVGMQTDNGIKDLPGLENARIQKFVRDYFTFVAPYNPDSMAEVVMKGTLRLRESMYTNYPERFQGYYELIESAESIYVLLEPLLKKILDQNPDVIVLPDMGARRFDAMIRWFIEEMHERNYLQKKPVVVNLPVSTRNGKDTAYQWRVWMRLLDYSPIRELTPEQAGALSVLQNYRQDLLDLRSAKSVVMLDEGLMEGSTGRLLEDVLREEGNLQEFSVCVPFSLAPDGQIVSNSIATIQMPMLSKGFIRQGSIAPLAVPFSFKSNERGGDSRREYSLPQTKVHRDAPAYQSFLLEGFKESFEHHLPHLLALQLPGIEKNNKKDQEPAADPMTLSFNPAKFPSTLAGMPTRPDAHTGYGIGLTQITQLTKETAWMADPVYGLTDYLRKTGEDVSGVSEDFYVLSLTTYHNEFGKFFRPNIAAVVVSVHDDPEHPGEKMLVIRKIQPHMGHDFSFEERDGRLAADVINLIRKHIQDYDGGAFSRVMMQSSSAFRGMSESHAVRKKISAIYDKRLLSFSPVDPASGRRTKMVLLWERLDKQQQREDMDQVKEWIEDIRSDMKKIPELVGKTEFSPLSVWTEEEWSVYEECERQVERGVLVNSSHRQHIRWIRNMTQRLVEQTLPADPVFLANHDDVEALKTRVLFRILVSNKNEMLAKTYDDFPDPAVDRKAWQKWFFNMMLDTGLSGGPLSFPPKFFQGPYSKTRIKAAFRYFLQSIWPALEGQNVSRAFTLNTLYRFGMGPAAQILGMRKEGGGEVGKMALFSFLLDGTSERSSWLKGPIVPTDDFPMNQKKFLRFLEGVSLGRLTGKTYTVSGQVLKTMSDHSSRYSGFSSVLRPGDKVFFFQPASGRDWAYVEGKGVIYFDFESELGYAPYSDGFQAAGRIFNRQSMSDFPGDSYVYEADVLELFIGKTKTAEDFRKYGFHNPESLLSTKISHEQPPSSNPKYVRVRVQVRRTGEDWNAGRVVEVLRPDASGTWNVVHSTEAFGEDFYKKPEDAAMLNYRRVTPTERAEILTQLHEQINRWRGEINEEFFEKVKDYTSGYVLESSSQKTFVPQKSLNALVFVANDEGAFFVLKKQEGAKNSRPHALFASMVSEAIPGYLSDDVKPLRNNDVIEGIEVSDKDRGLYYVSRLKIDDQKNPQDDIEEIRKNRVISFIVSIFLRQRDPHWNNLTPERVNMFRKIDTDRILTYNMFYRNGQENINDFYTMVLRSMEKVFPVPSSQVESFDEKWAPEWEEINELTEDRKYGEAFEWALKKEDATLEQLTELVRLSGYGRAFAEIFYMTPENLDLIKEVINQIKNIPDATIIEWIEHAGFGDFGGGSKPADQMFEYAGYSRDHLGTALNGFLHILTNKDYGLESLDHQGEDSAMLYSYRGPSKETKLFLKMLDKLIDENHSYLHRIRESFWRPLSLILMDKDDTLTENKEPLSEPIAHILDSITRLNRGLGQDFSLGVISGDTRDNIEAEVISRLSTETQKSFYIGAANGGQVYWTGSDVPLLDVSLKEEMGEDDWGKLHRIMEQEVRKEFEITNSEDVLDKTASWAVYERNDSEKRKKIQDFIEKQLRVHRLADKKFDGRFLKVQASSIAVNVSLYDKGDALDVIVAKEAELRNVPRYKIREETMGIVDSKLDESMATWISLDGGLAVSSGNPSDSWIDYLKLDKNFVVMSDPDNPRQGVRGSLATALALRMHQRWLMHKRAMDSEDPKEWAPLAGQRFNSYEWVYFMPRSAKHRKRLFSIFGRVAESPDGEYRFEFVNPSTGRTIDHLSPEEAQKLDIRFVPGAMYPTSRIRTRFPNVYRFLTNNSYRREMRFWGVDDTIARGIFEKWQREEFLPVRDIKVLDDELIKASIIRGEDEDKRAREAERAKAQLKKEFLQKRWSSVFFDSIFSFIPSNSYARKYSLDQQVDQRTVKVINSVAARRPDAAVTVFSKNSSFFHDNIRRLLSPAAQAMIYNSSDTGVEKQQGLFPVKVFSFKDVIGEDWTKVQDVLKILIDEEGFLVPKQKTNLEQWKNNPKGNISFRLKDDESAVAFEQHINVLFKKHRLKFIKAQKFNDQPVVALIIRDQVMLVNAIQKHIYEQQKNGPDAKTMQEIWKETLFVGRNLEGVDVMNYVVSQGGSVVAAGRKDYNGLEKSDRVKYLNILEHESAGYVFDAINSYEDGGENRAMMVDEMRDLESWPKILLGNVQKEILVYRKDWGEPIFGKIFSNLRGVIFQQLDPITHQAGTQIFADKHMDFRRIPDDVMVLKNILDEFPGAFKDINNFWNVVKDEPAHPYHKMMQLLVYNSFITRKDWKDLNYHLFGSNIFENNFSDKDIIDIGEGLKNRLRKKWNMVLLSAPEMLQVGQDAPFDSLSRNLFVGWFGSDSAGPSYLAVNSGFKYEAMDAFREQFPASVQPKIINVSKFGVINGPAWKQQSMVHMRDILVAERYDIFTEILKSGVQKFPAKIPRNLFSNINLTFLNESHAAGFKQYFLDEIQNHTQLRSFFEVKISEKRPTDLSIVMRHGGSLVLALIWKLKKQMLQNSQNHNASFDVVALTDKEDMIPWLHSMVKNVRATGIWIGPDTPEIRKRLDSRVFIVSQHNPKDVIQAVMTEIVNYARGQQDMAMMQKKDDLQQDDERDFWFTIGNRGRLITHKDIRDHSFLGRKVFRRDTKEYGIIKEEKRDIQFVPMDPITGQQGPPVSVTGITDHDLALVPNGIVFVHMLKDQSLQKELQELWTFWEAKEKELKKAGKNPNDFIKTFSFVKGREAIFDTYFKYRFLKGEDVSALLRDKKLFDDVLSFKNTPQDVPAPLKNPFREKMFIPTPHKLLVGDQARLYWAKFHISKLENGYRIYNIHRNLKWRGYYAVSKDGQEIRVEKLDNKDGKRTGNILTGRTMGKDRFWRMVPVNRIHLSYELKSEDAELYNHFKEASIFWHDIEYDVTEAWKVFNFKPHPLRILFGEFAQDFHNWYYEKFLWRRDFDVGQLRSAGKLNKIKKASKEDTRPSTARSKSWEQIKAILDIDANLAIKIALLKNGYVMSEENDAELDAAMMALANRAFAGQINRVALAHVMRSRLPNATTTGGVDFRMDSFDVNAQGERSVFDQAALAHVKISGLRPVLITLTPLKSLDEFLGVNSTAAVLAQGN